MCAGERINDLAIQGQFEVNIAGTYCANLTVNDDEYVEDTEMFTVRLIKEYDNDIIDGESAILITVTDNDCKFVYHFDNISAKYCTCVHLRCTSCADK